MCRLCPTANATDATPAAATESETRVSCPPACIFHPRRTFLYEIIIPTINELLYIRAIMYVYTFVTIYEKYLSYKSIKKITLIKTTSEEESGAYIKMHTIEI